MEFIGWVCEKCETENTLSNRFCEVCGERSLTSYAEAQTKHRLAIIQNIFDTLLRVLYLTDKVAMYGGYIICLASLILCIHNVGLNGIWSGMLQNVDNKAVSFSPLFTQLKVPDFSIVPTSMNVVYANINKNYDSAKQLPVVIEKNIRKQAYLMAEHYEPIAIIETMHNNFSYSKEVISRNGKGYLNKLIYGVYQGDGGE